MSSTAAQGVAATRTDAAPMPAKHARALRLWLGVLALLIVAMVLVGGATRLTDSGLSITEWQPIMGAVPPLSEADWQKAFEAYQKIPEYTELKQGMSLDQFKTIYWWEWAHRFLGRLIGIAFFVPFIGFWLLGYIPRTLLPRLIGLFILGGLQGAVGWYMVKSGLVAAPMSASTGSRRISALPFRSSATRFGSCSASAPICRLDAHRRAGARACGSRPACSPSYSFSCWQARWWQASTRGSATTPGR